METDETVQGQILDDIVKRIRRTGQGVEVTIDKLDAMFSPAQRKEQLAQFCEKHHLTTMEVTRPNRPRMLRFVPLHD